MKKFEVIYKQESEKLSKPYGSDDYYDVNGKVCYSVEVSEKTIKDIVFAKYKKSILKKYSNGELFIDSITEIDEKELPFEILAGDDYMRVDKSTEINSVEIGQRDKECSPEVQEEYLRTGNLNSFRSLSEW